jgi:hypothetical protein
MRAVRHAHGGVGTHTQRQTGTYIYIHVRGDACRASVGMYLDRDRHANIDVRAR